MFATATRAPIGDAERALVDAGFVFDPALDCVARRAGAVPDPKRYRHELAVGCGSPLYPVDARPVGTSLEATVAEMRKRFAPNVPVALGVSDGVVVIAGRLVDIKPFHSGDKVLYGKALMPIAKSEAYVSRADGVTRSPVALDHGSFAIPVSADPADLELAIVADDGTIGPLARFRIGDGSPLFGRDGSLPQRANAARKRLGLAPLRLVDGAGDCVEIPATIGGEDVRGKAFCHSAPLVSELDVLAIDLASRPLLQTQVLAPASAFLEIGSVGTEVLLRVTQHFEALTPDAGRQRILAQYRAWWPDLPERATPPGTFDAVFDAWKRAPDLTDNPPPEAKALLDRIAAKWTTSKRYWSALSASRDFDKAMEITKPDEKPLAIDAAMIQVRDHTGAMRHLIAVILVLP